MRPSEISPSFVARLEHLASLKHVPAIDYWSDQLKHVIDGLSSSARTIDDLLTLLHQSQRVISIYAAGLQNTSDVVESIEAACLPDWKDYGAPAVDEELQHSLADKLYNVERIDRPYAMVNIGNQAKVIAPHILKRLIKDGIPFDTHFREPDFAALLLNNADDQGIANLAAAYVSKHRSVNTSISVYSLESNITPDTDKKVLYATAMAEVAARRKSGDLYYTLTIIPTPEDARKDQIPYDDYVRLYFEMCDQPWELVQTTQDLLASQLDAGEELRITNSDGTDITISLVDHDGTPFTFANSVIGKNVPGSEVFTAPRRDGVNGKIVARGRYAAGHDDSKILENLTLDIVDGKIEHFEAETGAEYFQEYLDRDPNNAYAGELGIGTNPHLGRHVINGLLVEKIGGSFHLAWGDCYQFKEYEGKPVHLSNGNKTKTGDHWDMTIMLRGRGGNMELDGELIMENGRWLDPRFAVLNEGWAAIAVEERPDYWKEFKGYDENGSALWNEPD